MPIKSSSQLSIAILIDSSSNRAKLEGKATIGTEHTKVTELITNLPGLRSTHPHTTRFWTGACLSSQFSPSRGVVDADRDVTFSGLLTQEPQVAFAACKPVGTHARSKAS